MNVRALATLCLCAAITGQVALAQPPLTDDAPGMTCRYYLVGAKLAWARPGGDWLDKDGRAYGDVAFATTTLDGAADGQGIDWDVTSLVQSWLDKRGLPGALIVRAMASTRAWAADFHSRETADAAKQPTLVVEWSDGTSSELTPSADTYLSCASHASKGAEAILRVGPAMPAVLVFPLPSAGDRSVRRATLTLSVIKPRGNPAFGVFALAPPFGEDAGRVAGLASRYSRDRDIERDPDVLFATGFERNNWQREWSWIGKGNDAEPVDAQSEGFEPVSGRALKVMVRERHALGLNMHYRFKDRAGGEPEEAYFRYYVRFADDWGSEIDGGKLPGLAGTYNRGGWGQRRADGDNGWSARGSFDRKRPNSAAMANAVGIGSYVYHAGMRSWTGDHWGWNLGPSGLLERNRWYSVEQYVRLNDPGADNGVLRAWIDGALVFEKTDVRFRDSLRLRIESLWMNVYHGGTKPSPRDMTLYIDNVVVARRYIGPMAP